MLMREGGRLAGWMILVKEGGVRDDDHGVVGAVGEVVAIVWRGKGALVSPSSYVGWTRLDCGW